MIRSLLVDAIALVVGTLEGWFAPKVEPCPPIRALPVVGEVWQHCKGAQYTIKGRFVAHYYHWHDALCSDIDLVGQEIVFYSHDTIEAGDEVVLYGREGGALYGRSLEGFMDELVGGVFRFERVENAIDPSR